MDKATKNMLILGGAALAGGWGGSWAATRLGATLGLTLGPWGATAGVLIGSLLGTTVAKKVLEDQALAELGVSVVPEAVGGPAGAD